MSMIKKFSLLILFSLWTLTWITQPSQAAIPEILLLLSDELSERHTSFSDELFKQYHREIQPVVGDEWIRILTDHNQQMFQFAEGLKKKSHHLMLVQRELNLKSAEVNASEIQLALSEKGDQFKKARQLQKDLDAKLIRIQSLKDKIFQLTHFIDFQMNRLFHQMKAIDETHEKLQELKNDPRWTRCYCGFHKSTGHSQVDDQIDSLEEQLESMNREIHVNFGSCPQQLYSIYQDWKHRNIAILELHHHPFFPLGNQGEHVWRVMCFIYEKWREIQLLKRQRFELNEVHQQIHQNLGLDYETILEKKNLLKVQDQNIQSLTRCYSQQLATEHKLLEQKRGSLAEKSSDQVNLFQLLFRLKMEISQFEFEILNHFILFEVIDSMRFPGNYSIFNELKEDLEQVSTHVESQLGGEINRDYTFLEWITQSQEKKATSSKRLVLKNFENQTILNQYKLEGSERRELIDTWYDQLIENQSLYPKIIYSESFFKLFKEEQVDQFKKELFKMTMECRAEFIQVNLSDGEICYQVKLN